MNPCEGSKMMPPEDEAELMSLKKMASMEKISREIRDQMIDLCIGKNIVSGIAASCDFTTWLINEMSKTIKDDEREEFVKWIKNYLDNTHAAALECAKEPAP